MKWCSIVGTTLLILTSCAHALNDVGVNFGPNNCAMLSRSSAGSCVLTTDCEGSDISKVEFAFDCVAQSGNGDIVRHSFGVGGFEASEEFDTEVKCGRCVHAPGSSEEASASKPQKKKVEAILKPAPILVRPPLSPAAPVTQAPAHSVPAAKPAAKHEEKIPGAVVLRASAKTATDANAKAQFWPFTNSGKPEILESKPDAVKYGPDGCVSTYKSAEGHCIMVTDCKGVDVSDYEFGLVCVDKVGSPVKHLFGKDSFDAEESFDTLIKCDQCLGLENLPDQVALAGEVGSMAKDISNLKAVMKNISVNVQMLNEKVFPKAPAPAPAPGPAPAAAAPPKEEAKLLLHHSGSHREHRGNLRRAHRHHQHHHHRRRDDDDDEDRRDDDEEDDQVDRREPDRVEVPVPVLDAPVVAAPAVKVVDAPKPVAVNEASDDDDDGSDEGSDED